MNKVIPILFHYIRAKQRMRWTRKKLIKWQKKKQKKIEAYAQKHSPFYRENQGIVISKKEMMADFSALNTKGIQKEEALRFATQAEARRKFEANFQNITVGLSSGTSGNRGLFLASGQEKQMWCGNILARVLPKPPWKKQKIAFFLRANSPLYETVNSTRLSFRFFDLLENQETLQKKLHEYAPDILVGPPSQLLMLIGKCQPKTVISVAETLIEQDKRQLEDGFGVPINQVYQCTEGFLGYTCSHGTLHLNEDLVKVEKEPLNETHFIPVLTDLFRKTQPIIRYRLDDVLVEKKTPCPCGCPFLSLERIEGRKDDVLVVTHKNGNTAPLFPDFVIRALLGASPKIHDFEVRQDSLDSWTVFVALAYQNKVTNALHQLFDKLNIHPPTLTFTPIPPARNQGEKKRRIRRTYAHLF